MKIFVSAKPRSKEAYIKKIDDTHFIVAVKEPPVKGMANQAITHALSDYFNLPRTNIELVSGYTFKEKIFEIYM